MLTIAKLLSSNFALLFAIVNGVVVDRDGRPISNASITASGSTVVQRTNEQGRFSIPGEAPILLVSAPGFEPQTIDCSRVDCGNEVRAVLREASLSDQVTILATPRTTDLAESTESIRVFEGLVFRDAPSTAVDDTLRRAAGFSLFRRNSSRFSNPTTQGASLRGTGSSGASRMVVEVDRIPINDPFGGWIAWSRIPSIAIDRAEVLRGGASASYGSAAISGATRLSLRTDEAIDLEVRAGGLGTSNLAAYIARSGAQLSLERFESNGYLTIDPSAAGDVDRRVASDHTVAAAAYRKSFGPAAIVARASWFDEERGNGTREQVNATDSWTASLRASRGSFLLDAWRTESDFFQTFTAVAAGRNSETLTRVQSVPVTSWGVTGETSRASDASFLFGGATFRSVRATNDETVAATNARTRTSASETTAAAFAGYTRIVSSRFSWRSDVRVDRWHVDDVVVRRTSVSTLPSRGETEISPSIGALYEHRFGAVALNLHQSFRSPTLNELYRGFRVGNVQTNANESLEPERATGGELSLRTRLQGVDLRAQFFQTEIDGAIGNVTISSTPQLILRRRENFGDARSRGAELEASRSFGSRLRARSSIVFVDSRIVSSGTDALEGRRIPQVPRTAAQFELLHSLPRLSSTVVVRHESSQFDDDLNRFRLAPFTLVDLSLRFPIAAGFEGLILGENILGESVESGRTPLLTLGTPRILHLGIRWRR